MHEEKAFCKIKGDITCLYCFIYDAALLIEINQRPIQQCFFPPSK